MRCSPPPLACEGPSLAWGRVLAVAASSSSFWRTFVAFPLSEGTRLALAREAERVGRLDDRARIVPAENMHVTVAFLGLTRPEDVPAIAEALEEAVRGIREIDVRIDGLGAFPRPDAPKVVWAGLVEEGGGQRLQDVAARVARALGDLGYAVEARRWHAHVTLARVESKSPASKSPTEALKKILTEGHLQDTYETETLSDLHLMISERASAAQSPPRGARDGRAGSSESGSRYRPLATIPLEDSAEDSAVDPTVDPTVDPAEDDAGEGAGP